MYKQFDISIIGRLFLLTLVSFLISQPLNPQVYTVISFGPPQANLLFYKQGTQ
jgi:hypothetical protein